MPRSSGGGKAWRDRSRKLDDAVRQAARDLGASGGASAIRLTINDDGPGDTRGFDRLFVGLGATLEAFPDALRATIPTIREAHREVFRSEGAAGRGRWAPLSETWTVPERQALGYGGRHPILVREGHLRDHVLTTPAVISRTGSAVELRIAPAASVRGVRKYRALARGTTTALGTVIPPRPMVAIGPAAATRVTSSISRFLRQRAAANGL